MTEDIKKAIDIVRRWAPHAADSDEGIYVGGDMEELVQAIATALTRREAAGFARGVASAGRALMGEGKE
jgi:phage replication-related protein YjqB (UPF0714/DUF867 family)